MNLSEAYVVAITTCPGKLHELAQAEGLSTIDALRERALEVIGGATCETCYDAEGGTCWKASIPGHSVAIVTCLALGNGCRAWRPRA
jgi:hypothetical protein